MAANLAATKAEFRPRRGDAGGDLVRRRSRSFSVSVDDRVASPIVPERNPENLPVVKKALAKAAAEAGLPFVEAATDVEPADDVEPAEYTEQIVDTDEALLAWQAHLNSIAPTIDPWETATPAPAAAAAEPITAAVPVIAATIVKTVAAEPTPSLGPLTLANRATDDVSR